MGGIYRVSEDDNTVGVPFLKNIPFLGQFFRRSSVNNSDEELIFFITPRIIEGSFDDASMNKIASN
jgi:type IV pilus assembly protein PilQ